MNLDKCAKNSDKFVAVFVTFFHFFSFFAKNTELLGVDSRYKVLKVDIS